MKSWIITFVLTLGVAMLLETIWLYSAALSLYKTHVGELLTPKPHILPVVGFYISFITGVLVFVVAPYVQAPLSALFIGKAFLFGVVCYGAYGLTNLALIKHWSTLISITDTLWGGFLATALSCFAHLLLRKL